MSSGVARWLWKLKILLLIFVSRAHGADRYGGVAQSVGPVQVARRSDMDMNGHINNAAYLAWALETVPKDVFDKWQLTSVSLLSASTVTCHGFVRAQLLHPYP